MFTYEKEIEDDLSESIFNDYELLCSMYQDDIKEIKNTKEEELNFLIKINHSFNLDSSEIIDSIKTLKLKNVKIENDEISIPYWLQFNYDKKNKKLSYTSYIFWLKEKTDIINKIKEELSSIEEPYIYNAIEIIKENIDNTLNNNNIISVLSDIKLNNTYNYSVENALFTITGASKNCPDFLYEEEIEENIVEESADKNNNKKKESKKDEKKQLSEYELFLEKGGVKSEILTEKDYAFQSHGICVKNKDEVDLYRDYLLSNNKIKKATRNVFAYRFLDDKTNSIIEDYDDDGEHYAGTRILGFLKKMKIYNILILVSRFNGDLHLKQHSTKYLTIAEILIKDNKNLFSFE